MSNVASEHIYDYEVVTGWFVQDEPASLVHELPHGFGMLDHSKEGWKKLMDFITEANGEGRVSGTVHKLFFLARHGQGWHNVAESTYGTAEWDRYWSTLNGNGTMIWGPDPELTALGVQQAEAANEMWREHTKLGLPTPDVIYSSPFKRSIHTSIITFNGWFYPNGEEAGSEASKDVKRIIVEDLHETSGVHTCDMRNPKTIIAQNFPTVIFEDGFVENDPFWSAEHRETPQEQDVRARRAMDKMITAEGTFISVSSHSGTMSSLLRILGHQIYDVTPGGVVPVLVKATKRSPVHSS